MARKNCFFPPNAACVLCANDCCHLEETRNHHQHHLEKACVCVCVRVYSFCFKDLCVCAYSVLRPCVCVCLPREVSALFSCLFCQSSRISPTFLNRSSPPKPFFFPAPASCPFPSPLQMSQLNSDARHSHSACQNADNNMEETRLTKNICIHLVWTLATWQESQAGMDLPGLDFGLI